MKNQTENPVNEGSSLDDYFRKSLQNYQPEPPVRVWNSLNRKLLLAELLKFNFTNISRLIPFGILTGLTLVAVFVVLYNSETETVTRNSAVPATAALAEKNPVSPAAELVQEKKATEISSVPEASHTGNVTVNASAPGKSSTTVLDSYSGKAPEIFRGEGSVNISTAEAPASTFRMLPRLSLPEGWNSFVLPGYSPMTTIPKPGSPSFFSLTMSVDPEETFYKSEVPQSNEFAWWTNLGITYHFSRFTLSSGIHYGYSTSEASYRVNYRSNDSIGYFTDIISFYVDPASNNVVFNTKVSTVYDSIDHLLDDRARNRYSYLRIPVLFGIDLLQTSRFTLNFQAGPAFTFMIHEKEAVPYIDYPNARIIKINKTSPPRISTGWQIWTGLHLDYQLTSNFSIFAEPSFKYFVKPEYHGEETSDQQPYAAGIGIGIQYNFGKKK